MAVCTVAFTRVPELYPTFERIFTSLEEAENVLLHVVFLAVPILKMSVPALRGVNREWKAISGALSHFGGLAVFESAPMEVIFESKDLISPWTWSTTFCWSICIAKDKCVMISSTSFSIIWSVATKMEGEPAGH